MNRHKGGTVTPTHLQYDLGTTIHRAPVTLTYSRGSDGTWSWTLRKEAACQRDDTQVIFGITDEQLLAMADASEDKERKLRE